jgi:hypothetical protein
VVSCDFRVNSRGFRNCVGGSMVMWGTFKYGLYTVEEVDDAYLYYLEYSIVNSALVHILGLL